MGASITNAALIFAAIVSAQSPERFVETGPVGLVFPAASGPLSAEQVEERTHTASGGDSISETVVSHIHRDSMGRMRIEWGIEANQASARIIYLLDPVSTSSWILLVDSKTAVRAGPESGEFRVGFPVVGRPLPNRTWRTATEILESRMLQGLRAEGTRTTRTSAGQPQLKAVEEQWFVRDLHLTLLVKASGPGWTHTAELRKLDRREPDPALFAIPSDYTIQ